MRGVIPVCVLRGTGDQTAAGYHVTYSVPYFDHMDVIDALRYIRDTLDPSLAFRYSCKEGKCGLCGVLINGVPALACKRVIQPGEQVTIEPLPGFPLIKDLVVDRTPYSEEVRDVQLTVEQTSAHPRPIAAEKRSDYLEITNCVECGVCSATCPSGLAGNHPIVGPVGFLQSVRAALFDEVTELSDEGGKDLFRCFECGQCSALCPREVAVQDLMARARGKAVAKWPQGVSDVVRTLNTNHVLLSGRGVHGTSDWLRQADVRLHQQIGKTNRSIGLFVGCQFGTRTSLQHTPRHFAEMLLQAGIDFALLGPEEWCCGHPHYAAGCLEGVAEAARHNVQAFAECGVTTIVTGCPGCYRAWKHEYPQVVDQTLNYTVLHSSEFLLRLIAEGKLHLESQGSQQAAYHDPCELARLSGLFDPPRQVLDAVPDLEWTEPAKTGMNSLCCGGGGLTLAADPGLSAAVSRLRIEEIGELKVSELVTACPNCEFTLLKAGRSLRGDGGIPVLDLVDVVYASLTKAGR